MRRDGTSIIFIQYCQSAEKRTLLNSGIAIPSGFWSLKRLRINADLPKAHGHAECLNDQLQKAIRDVEDILSFAAKRKISEPLTFLKKAFKQGIDLFKLEEKSKETELPKVNLDVFFQIDEYIKSKTRQVSPKMLHVFRNMKETQKAFEAFRKKPITFDSFDF